MQMNPANLAGKNFSCTHYVVCALACHLLYIAWKLAETKYHHAMKLSADYSQILRALHSYTSDGKANKQTVR